MLILAAMLAVAAPGAGPASAPPLVAVAATPAPDPRYEKLVALARSSQAAVGRHDFSAARGDLDRLTRAWTAVRPATLQGLKGRALAQSFDSHLKWLASAIAREDPSEVKRVLDGLTRTVHEIEERKPA